MAFYTTVCGWTKIRFTDRLKGTNSDSNQRFLAGLKCPGTTKYWTPQKNRSFMRTFLSFLWLYVPCPM